MAPRIALRDYLIISATLLYRVARARVDWIPSKGKEEQKKKKEKKEKNQEV